MTIVDKKSRDINENTTTKNFDSFEITSKIYIRMIDNQTIKTRIENFNKTPSRQFYETLYLHLGRSLMKHSTPKQLKEWIISNGDSDIMNDCYNYASVFQISEIVKDFLLAETPKARERISICPGVNIGCYDYSIICSRDDLKNYKSILFAEDNYDIITWYYNKFIWNFPVTLYEFERTFFYLLTHIEDEYPFGVTGQQIKSYVSYINQIVRMRYIDIHNWFIILLLYIFTYDEDLRGKSNYVYTGIETSDRFVRSGSERD